METRNKNIDELFKERLEGYSEAPPDMAWEKLQKNLSGNKPAGKYFPLKWINYFLGTCLSGILLYAGIKILFNNKYEQKIETKKDTKSLSKTELQKNEISNDVNYPNPLNIDTINNNKSSTIFKTSLNNKIIENNHARNSNVDPKSKIIDENGKKNETHLTAIVRYSENRLNKNNRQSNIVLEHNNKKDKLITERDANQNKYVEGKNNKNDGNGLSKHQNIRPALFLAGNLNNGRKHALHKTNKKKQEYYNKDKKENHDISDNSIVGNTTNLEKTIIDDNANFFMGNDHKMNTEKYIDSIIKKFEKFQKDSVLTMFNQKKLPKPKIPKSFGERLSIGIKGGFETEFNGNTTQNMLVSPFIEWKISQKISFVLQPGIKSVSMPIKQLNGSQSFIHVNNDGNVTKTDSTMAIVYTGNINYDTFLVRNYRYSQSHDSIVKSYSFGGNYINFELPIMIKYKLLGNLSILGGLNILYNQNTSISENTYNDLGIMEYKYNSTFAPIYKPAPPISPISSVITYDAVPISDYKGPLYHSASGGNIAIGFIAGLNYEFNNRILLDFMMQKSNIKSKIVAGENLNNASSALYWRILIGYKIK